MCSVFPPVGSAESYLGSDSVSVLKASIVCTSAGWLCWGEGLPGSLAHCCCDRGGFRLNLNRWCFFSLPLILKFAHSLAHSSIGLFAELLRILFSPSSVFMCWHMCLCARQPCLHSLPGRDALKFNSHSSFCANTLCLLLIYAGFSKAVRGISRKNDFPCMRKVSSVGFE